MAQSRLIYKGPRCGTEEATRKGVERILPSFAKGHQFRTWNISRNSHSGTEQKATNHHADDI